MEVRLLSICANQSALAQVGLSETGLNQVAVDNYRMVTAAPVAFAL